MTDLCRPDAPEPRFEDALTRPAVDDLHGVVMSLLPVGAAWGTPDNVAPPTDSVRARFWKAFASSLVDLYATISEVARSSTASSQTTATTDYETEYGIPDPCREPPADVSDRNRAIVEHKRARGINSKADFVCFFQTIDRRISVEEFVALRIGDPIGNVPFMTDAAEWTVRFTIDDTPLGVPFEFGWSRIGTDPITDFVLPYDAECIIRRFISAEIVPLIQYAPLLDDPDRITSDDETRETTDGTDRVISALAGYQFEEISA